MLFNFTALVFLFAQLFLINAKSFRFNVNYVKNEKNKSDNPPLLILISFDGFRWDYLENNTLSYFNKYFVNDGVKANRGIKNSFSTVTFPNHWTIATGLYPETHGIVANVMYDSVLQETFYDFGKYDNDTNWFGQNPITMPIWLLNQIQDKNHRRSGIVGAFPGSNVKIANETAYLTTDYGLEEKLNWFVKVDTLIKWFLDGVNPINFGVLYFAEPDDTGHQYGPYSDNIKDMLQNCDAIIGYLIRRLKNENLFDRMNIIITSDHGMDTASLDHAINLNDFVNISKFNNYGGLTEINIFPKDPNDEDEIYEGLKNIEHYNIYRKSEVLSRLNYKNNVRIGQLVMFGDVGYETFRSGKENWDWKNWNGDHGGDNQKESMHPVFVARGPRFKKGYLANQFNNVDIYILMCTILDISPLYPHNGSYDNIKDMLSVTRNISLIVEETVNVYYSIYFNDPFLVFVLVIFILLILITQKFNLKLLYYKNIVSKKNNY